MKFGIAPKLPIGHDAISSSFQSGMGMMSGSPVQNPTGSIQQLATKLPEHYPSKGVPGFGNKTIGSNHETFVPKNTSVDSPFASRTEQVISSFLQNPILKGEEREPNEVVCNRWNMFAYQSVLCFILLSPLLWKVFCEQFQNLIDCR